MTYSKYTIKEIAKVLEADLNGNPSNIISSISIDSRSLELNENTLFFCLTGARNDAHDYIPEIQEKGVACFVVSKFTTEQKTSEGNLTFLLVPDVLKAFQKLAAYHRDKFSKPVIGITGSNGKTIVKEWLAQLLSLHGPVVRSPKSYNSQVGVPLSVWLLNNDADYGIIEAGISLPGEMDKLEAIIKPEIGIFTCIGQAHQEGFSSIKEKIIEKLTLFKNSEALIYCIDHEDIHKAIHTVFSNSEKPKLIGWSKKNNQDAWLMVDTIHQNQQKSIIKYSVANTTNSLEVPFTDEASVENCIHILTVLHYLNYSPQTFSQGFANLSPVAMRLEQKKGINNCTLINDSYNSDLNSLTIALEYLNRQKQHTKKTLILSDIFQSGMFDVELYSTINGLLKKYGIERFIGVGSSLFKNQNVFKVDSRFYKTTEELLKNLPDLSFSNELILIKGSRAFEFEGITHYLEYKTHRTTLEVNLNSLIENLNYFKSKIKPSTKMMVMVKAFSYGSGSHEIASLLQFHKVDYLAVAFIDEGVELRKAGIKIPILVMNPEAENYHLMTEYSLEPAVFDMQSLQMLIQMLKNDSINEYPVHIKIETGMNRLGFVEDEMNSLIKLIEDNSVLHVKSIFSHLAASDDPNEDEFTRSQFRRFERMADKISAGFNYKIIRHILNSAGIERFPEAQYEMVRLGIGIYGISSIPGVKLSHISTLKSMISQIKQVTPDDTVGYNRKGRVSKDSRIAVVPIGYADGLHRKFSNGVGKFLINGKFAPIIGNICMDMTMVDITGIDAKIGDEVYIFNDQLPITWLANQIVTIPYEILTSISGRVKRVYFHE